MILFSSANCTTEPDDFSASYKFRPLKHVLSRGDFKPSNERVQTDKRQISKRAVHVYLRSAKQYESDSSMTDEAHDTNLKLLVFLNLKK